MRCIGTEHPIRAIDRPVIGPYVKMYGRHYIDSARIRYPLADAVMVLTQITGMPS
jgi:hypothetical protein